MNFLLKVVVSCVAVLLVPSLIAGTLAVSAFDGSSTLMVWSAGFLAFTGMLTFLCIWGAGPILFLLSLGLLVAWFDATAGEHFRSQRRQQQGKLRFTAVIRTAR